MKSGKIIISPMSISSRKNIFLKAWLQMGPYLALEGYVSRLKAPSTYDGTCVQNVVLIGKFPPNDWAPQ